MNMNNYFDEVYGHEGVKNLLSEALDTGRIGHAYIFCGPKGVGRYTVAEAFAHGALETNKAEHPDIITVTNELYGTESKSDSILVDTVSEMRKDIFIKPYSGKRKFYIMPRGDTMNAASQNKLLKVFEEPPEYCTIIFIAENISKFLPTILSRATVIRFSPLSESQVERYLTERCGLSESEAVSKAVISGGSIGAAKDFLGSTEPDRLRAATIDGILGLLTGENKCIFEFAKFLKSEKDNTDFIFSVIKSFLSDIVHLKLGLDNNIVNKDKTAELERLLRAVTESGAVRMLDIAVKYERVYKTNANFRMTMFCMACEFWEEIHGRDYRSTI